MKVRSEAQLDQIIGEAQVPVLVKFQAAWCRPCASLAPRYTALAADLGDKAVCVEVDVDENHEAAVKHGIHSVPTILMFVKGAHTATSLGSKTTEQLKEWVSSHLPE